jgi:hypothetical protein
MLICAWLIIYLSFTAQICLMPNSAYRAGPPYRLGFVITFRHMTLFRTLLDEWSARRKPLYMTIQNTDKWYSSMSPAGLEHAIPECATNTQWYNSVNHKWFLRHHWVLYLMFFSLLFYPHHFLYLLFFIPVLFPKTCLSLEAKTWKRRASLS